MFCITVTRNPIKDNLKSYDVHEITTRNFVITIVTDNSLSHYVLKHDGFTVRETPQSEEHQLDGLMLSEVTCDVKTKRISFFSSTISGRPMYYHLNSQGEFFCSSHISLLRKAGVEIRENEEVLPEFFIYRYVMPPQTLYKNILRIRNGCRLHITFSDERCEIHPEDCFNPFEKAGSGESLTPDTIQKQTLDYLYESISVLHPYKDRLTVLLSGGLDSSLLYKLCNISYGTNKSYSTAYPFQEEKTNLEKEYALSAAHAFGSHHIFYESSNREYLYGLIKSISTAEEPVDHLQSVMFYLLFCNGLPEDKSVILSGDGADGVWGLRLHNFMYNYYKKKKLYDIASKAPVKTVLQFVSGITGKGKDFVNSLHLTSKLSRETPPDDPDNIIWNVDSYGSVDWVCRYFHVRPHDIIVNRWDSIKNFRDRPVYDLISIIPLFSTARSIWSKLGEEYGKTLYYPFHNRNLLEYAYSINWDTKLENPKNVLRGIASQLGIHDFIITRKKSGFGVHPEHWARKGCVFEPLVSLALPIFDEKVIRSFQSSDSEKAMTFWNILNYSLWKRLCINNEPVDALLEELEENII